MSMRQLRFWTLRFRMSASISRSTTSTTSSVQDVSAELPPPLPPSSTSSRFFTVTVRGTSFPAQLSGAEKSPLKLSLRSMLKNTLRKRTLRCLSSTVTARMMHRCLPALCRRSHRMPPSASVSMSLFPVLMSVPECLVSSSVEPPDNLPAAARLCFYQKKKGVSFVLG